MVSDDSEELDYVDDMVDPDDQGSINGEQEDELSSSPPLTMMSQCPWTQVQQWDLEKPHPA